MVVDWKGSFKRERKTEKNNMLKRFGMELNPISGNSTEIQRFSATVPLRTLDAAAAFGVLRRSSSVLAQLNVNWQAKQPSRTINL